MEWNSHGMVWYGIAWRSLRIPTHSFFIDTTITQGFRETKNPRIPPQAFSYSFCLFKIPTALSVCHHSIKQYLLTALYLTLFFRRGREREREGGEERACGLNEVLLLKIEVFMNEAF